MLERNDVDADRYQDKIAYSELDIIEARERVEERVNSILLIEEDSNVLWDALLESRDEWNEATPPKFRGMIKSFEQMTPSEVEAFVKSTIRFHEAMEYSIKTHCETEEGI